MDLLSVPPNTQLTSVQIRAPSTFTGHIIRTHGGPKKYVYTMSCSTFDNQESQAALSQIPLKSVVDILFCKLITKVALWTVE